MFFLQSRRLLLHNQTELVKLIIPIVSERRRDENVFELSNKGQLHSSFFYLHFELNYCLFCCFQIFKFPNIFKLFITYSYIMTLLLIGLS